MDQKEQIKGKIFNMKNPHFKIYQDASWEIKDVVILQSAKDKSIT